MFGISFAELVIIFLLILVVMGPEKLPEVARWLGKGMRQLREASNTVRNSLAVEDFEKGNTPSRRIDSGSSAAASSPTGSVSEPSDSGGSSPDSTGDPTGGSPPPENPPADAGPTNLDQVDDTHFERMLERQVRANRPGNDTEQIDLTAAQSSDELIEVALPPAAGATPEALFDVALPTTPAAEAA